MDSPSTENIPAPVLEPRSPRFGGLREKAPRFTAIAVVIAVVSCFTIPRLPPGICFHDWGDLQIASATLGIAHPPGYAGYATIGHLLTRIPGPNPAYIVTLACFVSGLFVLIACLKLQHRFGVNIWLSMAVAIALAAHPRFWLNLRAPEVYMPTLALLAWSIVLLLRYHDTSLRRHLACSVFFFGFAMGSRPPIMLASPFFLLAWLCAAKPWVKSPRKYFANLAWMIPLVIAPTAYSAIFIYLRDRPDVCYNYIDLHNEEGMTLPESSEGFEAKVRRVAWEMSGQEFREYMGTDWPTFVNKLRWLRTQIVYEHPVTDLLVLLLTAVGLSPPQGAWYGHIDVYAVSLLGLAGIVVLMQRCRIGGWPLIGLIIYTLVFVLTYQVFAQSADLLPVIFSLALALAVLSSKIIPPDAHWIKQTFAAFIALGAAALFAVHDPPDKQKIDAAHYLEELDFATFPGPAVLCGNWTKSTPMRYAQCVQSPRTDLRVVTSGHQFCIATATRTQDRPVYAADVPDSQGRCTTQPFRNVYLLKCSESKSNSNNR